MPGWLWWDLALRYYEELAKYECWKYEYRKYFCPTLRVMEQGLERTSV